MFYFEENLNKYFIYTDKIKWKFWPFKWIYVKNKIYWNFSDKIDVNNYPWYKYSIWIWEKMIFIIWLDWIIDIINI